MPDTERQDMQGPVQPAYVAGERVYGAIDDCPGTVLSVDAEFDTFTVQWDGNDFPVVYDAATIMVRRPWPWET